MLLKGLIEEDFVNYRKPSMVIMMPTCNWKCGKGLCQNSSLATGDNIQVTPEVLAFRYANNDITEALVFSGLEPLDDFDDVLSMIRVFRRVSDDDIVIYTGYNKKEISQEIAILKQQYSNIIIKFGRFIPNDTGHVDPILGVTLASNNQYAEKIC